MGCAQSRGLGSRVPRRLGFIVLVSFSDALLVVSTLDMGYDYHLWGYGLFVPWG